MSVVIGISCMSWLHGFYIKMIWLWTCGCTTVRSTLSSDTMISYPTDIATIGQKQLVIVLGSIIGGVVLTTFICSMVLLICCCTTSCPMHRAYYESATLSSSNYPQSNSRTRGAYVALQNSSDTQELELPPPPSPPPSYSETSEMTQPQNAWMS